MFKKRSLEDEVREYMASRYGKEFLSKFKILGTGGQSMFAKHIEISAICSDFPDDVIHIKKYPREKFGNDHDLFRDNYVGICRREELEAEYEKIFEGIYNNFEVYLYSISSVSVVPNVIDMNTPVEEFIRSEHIDPRIELFVYEEPDDKDNKAREVVKRYLTIKQHIDLEIRYINYKNEKGEYLYSDVSDDVNGNIDFTWEFTDWRPR